VTTLDAFNPQVAARMASGFKLAPRLTPELQGHMRRELEQVRAGHMSTNVGEVINNTYTALNQ